MGVLLIVLDNAHVESEASKFALRVVNAVLTALLLGLLCWRFVEERDILIRRNVLPPDVSFFRMPKQLLQLALELAICAIFVPPGTSGSFDVREWKFYTTASATGGVGSGVSGQKDACGAPFVVRDGSCYLEYSYPYHTSYLGTLHRVDTMSPLFAVKCFLQSHPFRLLLAAFLGTLVLTTYALAIVEAPVNPNLVPISNALWLVVLTMATVGYGDIVPVTITGQALLTFGGMLAGILLIGALVRCTSCFVCRETRSPLNCLLAWLPIQSAVFFGFLDLDERDKRFIHLLRHQECDWGLKQACARSIQAAWGRFYASQSGEQTSNRRRYRKRKPRPTAGD
ncbi:hypothetical protein BBJ28_00001812 [Nothophytophthora sp. Chile5]|nr:hypothetical protein BBJ28_00001812 [Nothophytophthora sp. Chile5]